MKASIRVFISALIMLIGFSLNAQFSDTLNVVFEKKLNVEKLILKYAGENMQDRMKYFDKIQIENYSFVGTTHHSIYSYKPKNADEEPKRSALFGYNGTENIVYNNYDEKKCSISKLVYDEKMLVNDTLKKFKWRISNETRDILGFKCRKATSIINDSVTIYAFYAQELLCTGGPETFNGLPGMILGVAVPMLHTTWFATSVFTKDVNLTVVSAPTKGKKHNYNSLNTKLSDALKDWGKIRNLYVMLNSI